MMLSATLWLVGLCALVGFVLLAVAAVAVVWVIVQEKQANSKRQ